MPTPNTSNKKAKLNPNGLKRVFKMVWNDYKWLIIIIAILVCVNSFANVYGNAFQQRLIDDYITPMLATSSKDFSPLLSAIIQMIVIYAIGVVASYVLNRLTVKISLGTLNNVRERLFAHMQTLPIKYFDTHPHGDIMSVYTNDTDTLRQTISSSIPQVFSSLIYDYYGYHFHVLVILDLSVNHIIFLNPDVIYREKDHAQIRKIFPSTTKGTGSCQWIY